MLYNQKTSISSITLQIKRRKKLLLTSLYVKTILSPFITKKFNLLMSVLCIFLHTFLSLKKVFHNSLIIIFSTKYIVNILLCQQSLSTFFLEKNLTGKGGVGMAWDHYGAQMGTERFRLKRRGERLGQRSRRKLHLLVFNNVVPAHNEGPMLADHWGWGGKKFVLLVSHPKTLAWKVAYISGVEVKMNLTRDLFSCRFTVGSCWRQE